MPRIKSKLLKTSHSVYILLMILGLALPSATTFAADGKAVFNKTCKNCHLAGVGGAPKFKDKAAWAPRIAQGMDILTKHALKGFKGKAKIPMPPKGGNPKLSDDEVKAAIQYMVDAAK